MAGALIVEGALDELPELKGLTERLFILRAATFDDVSATLGGEPTLFVNNQVQPTVPIARRDAALADRQRQRQHLHESGARRPRVAPDRLRRQPTARGSEPMRS